MHWIPDGCLPSFQCPEYLWCLVYVTDAKYTIIALDVLWCHFFFNPLKVARENNRSDIFPDAAFPLRVWDLLCLVEFRAMFYSFLGLHAYQQPIHQGWVEYGGKTTHAVFSVALIQLAD